jgi:hypothetical protein
MKRLTSHMIHTAKNLYRSLNQGILSFIGSVWTPSCDERNYRVNHELT